MVAEIGQEEGKIHIKERATGGNECIDTHTAPHRPPRNLCTKIYKVRKGIHDTLWRQMMN